MCARPATAWWIPRTSGATPAKKPHESWARTWRTSWPSCRWRRAASRCRGSSSPTRTIGRHSGSASRRPSVLLPFSGNGSHGTNAARRRGVGLTQFDVITSVPSTSGSSHPLPRLISQVVEGSGTRYRDLLVVNRPDLGQREQAADRYSARESVSTQHVLVIDDTWTTGAHAQSASAALKAAGASSVGLVALGRWVTPDFREHGAWLARHRQPGWSWSSCCLEAQPQNS